MKVARLKDEKGTMTEQQKITNWSYPFKARATPGAERAEDAWLYQEALANALGGHYPLGTNGLWHGGVHFDQGSAGLLDQSSVYCIADGEVIAYRIDERYPVSEYESGPKPYSTGFVLVRHRLEVPKPTPADATQTAAEAASPSPSLTLFSLYMHLLDWDHYGLEAAPNPPAFISETLYTVKPDKATDPTLGLRVRATPGNGPVIALLPKGCRVEVGDAHPGSVKWRRLINVIEGSALPSLAGCDSGWVFTGEMESTPAPNVFLVGEHANDHEPNLAPQRGLNVRKTGRGNASDAKTGLLPEGTRVSLEPGTTPYRKIKAIIEGTALPPLAANSVQNIQGYVHFDSLQATRTTPVCGAVHLLDPPYPIKAGELIGHPGHYQNHNDGAPQTLLHLEVFSCDDVPAFIAQSRALAAALPAEQKTQLKIHKGASKLIPHREGIDANHPPSITDAGTTIGVDLIIPLSTLERLPPSHKISINTATSPGPVTHWWRLDNLLADNDGNPISGWLAEQDLITTRHSPWEWEGFECVEDHACNADHLACHLDTGHLLEEAEQTQLQPQITSADKGPLKDRLYKIIDGADGSVRDNKLSAAEIHAAIGKCWNAQAISRLICNYESEWFWQAEKWNTIDKILGTDAEKKIWIKEKKRIETLCWWEHIDTSLGVSSAGIAWHLSSMALLDYHKEIAPIIMAGKITFDAEGNDISSSPFFSRAIHWPGNALSGVTIGRGYDMGFRSEGEICSHMNKAGINLYQAQLISRGHGLKGEDAKNFVKENKSTIGYITTDQQARLFNLIYPEYVRRTIQNYQKWTAQEPSAEAWENLHPSIKDILVDFVYQGFTAGPNPMKAGMRNSEMELINYIENTEAIRIYEPGRHRAKYLRDRT